MPGHLKKSEGDDPDPDPWLVVSEDLRKKLNSKPYDPKKIMLGTRQGNRWLLGRID
jgi:hypothetical protein